MFIIVQIGLNVNKMLKYFRYLHNQKEMTPARSVCVVQAAVSSYRLQDRKDEEHLLAIADLLIDAHLTTANMLTTDTIDEGITSSSVPYDIFEKIQCLLQPPFDEYAKFKAYRDLKDTELPAIDIVRLLQLAQMQAAHPDKKIVVVDDRDYASLIKDGGGIHLAEHERAHY